MRPIDPQGYFDSHSLVESLVLRFLYRPAEAKCHLVFDYAAEAVSNSLRVRLSGQDILSWPSETWPPRDLRHLLFTEVASIGGPQADPSGRNEEDWWQQFEFQLLSKPTVITDCALETTGDLCSLRLAFCRAGRVTLSFTRMFEERRLGKGIERDGSGWDYFDVDTQDPFDFFNPFPAIGELPADRRIE